MKRTRMIKLRRKNSFPIEWPSTKPRKSTYYIYILKNTQQQTTKTNNKMMLEVSKMVLNLMN